MIRKSWKGVMLLAATGLSATLATPALAEGEHTGGAHAHHEAEHRHTGVLYINGRAFQVNGPGAFHDELYGAFRRSGYRCDFDQGRFRIYVGARRPAISWRGGCGCGTVSFTYSRGYLYVNLGGGFSYNNRPHFDDRTWYGNNSPYCYPTPQYKPVPHYQPRLTLPSVRIYTGTGRYSSGSWNHGYRWPSYPYSNQRGWDRRDWDRRGDDRRGGDGRHGSDRRGDDRRGGDGRGGSDRRGRDR